MLRIPAQLRAVLLGGFATLACSSAPSTPPMDGGLLSDGSSRDGRSDASRPPADGGRDARVTSLDGGPCKIKVPPGNVCETTCYNISTDPPSPYACQVYCTPPDGGGTGHCSCNGGGEPEGGIGICPGGLDCDLEAFADGGEQVLC